MALDNEQKDKIATVIPYIIVIGALALFAYSFPWLAGIR